MVEINIAKEFTVEPGARVYSDGPGSGEEFFYKLLKPRYEEALLKNVKLKVILDGTDGFASSFINEAFIRMGEEFGPENVWKNLILVSNEIPKYIIKVKDSLYEKRK